jgi:hypothetical protein
MRLSIRRFFENNGIILEMKDWKSHFAAGTKGQPRTEMVILDYVEDILSGVYDNEEKVKNSPIAPWLVRQVAEIGVTNIGTDDRSKMLTVIEWVKETGGAGAVKSLSLPKAYEVAQKALENIKLKKSLEKSTEAATTSIPETEDEKDGKVLRVGVLKDGSKRMWVKVLKDSWNKEKCATGAHKGVQCQASHNFLGQGYDQYTLIGPPKGNPEGPVATIMSMNVWPGTKAVTELKQEGNQQPGVQVTSGGWDDADKQFIDFVAFNPVGRENIDRFHEYQQNEQEPRMHEGSNHIPWGGGAGAMWFIMDKNPELFNRLVTARPDIRDLNKNIILSHHKFGKKWFETYGIDVTEYAKENPERFIQDIDRFEFVGAKKIEEALNGIDINKIAAKNPKLVLSKIDKLLNNLSVEMFKKIISTIDMSNYISKTPEKFKELIKMMSSSKNTKYRDAMVEMIYENMLPLIDASGGGTKGLYDLLDFLSMPKMHRFSRKGVDGQIYAIKKVTVVDPATGDRTVTEEEFPLRDDLSIMPQKERRKIIDHNKEWIKSQFVGTEEEKEIKYLRVLFKEINPQDIERTIRGEKEKFVNYYDKNPSRITGFPGIIEFYSVINRGKPGYVVTSPVASGKQKTYYKMDLDEFKNKNVLKRLLKYFYSNSDQSSTEGKMYEAAQDLLKTMETSGESSENIAEFAKKEFSPKSIVKIIEKSDLLKMIKDYKNDIINSGITGSQAYKDFLTGYSEKSYEVKKGDMIMFTGMDFDEKNPIQIQKSIDKMEGIYLTKGKKYKVSDVSKDEFGSIRNSSIEVIDDRKKKKWYPTSMFDVKKINVISEVRKYVIKKMLEAHLVDEMKEKGEPKYSAVVLDNKSNAKLLEMIPVPEGWEKIAHHMTITMGGLENKELIGERINMRVTEMAGNDKVIAVKVETDVPSKNEIKHITVAVNRDAGGKPVMSNSLDNWRQIKTPFFISGVIEEIY